MSRERPGEMRIGEVLREAREREGLDLREVEQRTKIRLKYLRALEAEDWVELPSSAYAKGFLRTYAQLVGLDAEALVDEFRRQVEGASGEAGYPLGDQVLERRRRAGRRPRGHRVAILAAIAALVVIVAAAAIGLTGSDDEPGRGDRGGGHAGADKRGDQGKDRGKRGEGESSNSNRATTLALTIRDSVEVCLLGGGANPLIAQVLAPGTEESYTRRKFELRFPSGFDSDQFRLELGGHERLLPKAKGAVAYSIRAPKRVTELPERPGEECP
ncbi:MAG: helix-turn-helix domain-containing protein [Solirubrobacterales bacterium]|nr:helix-turn-helix domain-containing protein [Solirubrobacterales bacterium]